MKQSIGRPRKYFKIENKSGCDYFPLINLRQEEREKEENPTESGFCWDEMCVLL